MYETQKSIGSRTGSNGVSSATKSDEAASPTKKNALMKLKSYLIALRVWSLSGSIIPTILGKCFSSGRVMQAISAIKSNAKYPFARFSVSDFQKNHTQ